MRGIARGLSRRGFRVLSVDAVHNSYVEFHGERESRVPLRRSIVVALLSYILLVLDRLLAALIRFPIEEVRRITCVFDVALLLDSIRLASHVKPDVIQVEEYYSLLPVAAIVKMLTRSRMLVLDEHNIDVFRLSDFHRKNWLFWASVYALEKLGVSSSDCTFVTSEVEKSRLRCLWKSNEVVVIPNFVSLESIRKSREGFPSQLDGVVKDSKPVLMFHGDFRYPPNREAVHVILDKFLPQLRAVYPAVLILVAGPGLAPERRPNVVFLGYVRDIYDAIRHADVALVPLLNGGGTRIKVLEYMACGVPVVSTPKGVEGLSLENRKEVLICDIDSTVSELIALLEDKSLRESIVRSAFGRIYREYDANRVCAQIATAYREYLGF